MGADCAARLALGPAARGRIWWAFPALWEMLGGGKEHPPQLKEGSRTAQENWL